MRQSYRFEIFTQLYNVSQITATSCQFVDNQNNTNAEPKGTFFNHVGCSTSLGTSGVYVFITIYSYNHTIDLHFSR